MSDSDEKRKKDFPNGCKDINLPSISGWGCCQCRTLNGIISLQGDMRTKCKYCDHFRCTKNNDDNEELPTMTKDLN